MTYWIDGDVEAEIDAKAQKTKVLIDPVMSPKSNRVARVTAFEKTSDFSVVSSPLKSLGALNKGVDALSFGMKEKSHIFTLLFASRRTFFSYKSLCMTPLSYCDRRISHVVS